MYVSYAPSAPDARCACLIAGKLIVLGACFGAVDETLTIAAGLTSRNPFMSPFDRRDEADWSRTRFAHGTQ